MIVVKQATITCCFGNRCVIQSNKFFMSYILHNFSLLLLMSGLLFCSITYELFLVVTQVRTHLFLDYRWPIEYLDLVMNKDD